MEVDTPLMWFGQARSFNATVAMVAALVWFTGTHHCLLGLMVQSQGRALTACHCPDHSRKPGDPNDGPSRMLACCQGLQSSNFEVAKAKITFNPMLVGIQLFAIGHVVLPKAPKSILQSTEYDTGPPSASSFVGTMLRRSLRENAPPLLS